MITETVELAGHILDSLTLPKVLDMVISREADYRIVEMEVGRTNLDPSRVLLELTTGDSETMNKLIAELHIQGANLVGDADAEVVACETAGVLPAGFYATTNLPTRVRIGGTWIEVSYPEMDCALVVDETGARAVPMHAVRPGDPVVVGQRGVTVEPPRRARDRSAFEFMNSDASSEKPKGLIVARVADRVRAAHRATPPGKVLAVCGPAVIHTGAGPDLARLVAAGWIDVLFAGNGFATHDIESNMLGTSLGVSMAGEASGEEGHSNHLVAINEVRRHGSIAAAVKRGALTGGVMFECCTHHVPFVLGGSVRDDGPLPDVITDVVAAADAMRSHLPGVGVALMLASTLHAIATGNLLAASVETFCIDINQAVVTKLADRGSHQALGIVTDVGLFLRELADNLCRD